MIAIQMKKSKRAKTKSIKLIIKRQDNQDSKPYEETFEIPYKRKYERNRMFNGNQT